MLRTRLVYQRVMAKIKRRKFKPISTLDADILRQAVEEARMLKSRYAVDVQPLAPGEKPDIPKPVE
ncbi:MAG: hypothetical protein ACK502_01575 [Alphaproteobacteria bacterium]